MLKRFMLGTAVVALLAAGSTAWAEECSIDCDSTLRQGRVFAADDSVVIFGSGDTMRTRVWIPLLLDDGGALLNNSVVNIVDGRILGGVTSFSATPYAVACFGTADQYDSAGGYTSNNIVVYESNAYSDTVGQLLTDGSLIWRANYAGTAQNNLEWHACVPGEQTPIPEPESGTPILVGPGIDSTGTAYLSTPGAILGGDGFYVGDTNFDGFTGNIPRGVNIWNYDKTNPSSSQTPDYSYLQADAETFANLNGVAVDPGDGRQTQPVFGEALGVKYVAFGINDTNDGGSARPAMIAIDAFEDGDGFTGAVAILPPTGYLFVDHQSTGGGSNVYENSHFDMNNQGQITVLTESFDNADPNHVPTYQALLYNPIITGGRITGYEPPVIIADAGPDDAVPEDGLVGPYYVVFDPNDPNSGGEYINALSGIAINNAGNIAFAGLYDTGIPFDPNDPNSPTRWDDAVYFYDASTTTLHQVLRESDVITYDGNSLAFGPIAREDSDGFMGANLADDADVLCVNFRANRDVIEGGSRGVAVVAVGHVGDVDFDRNVDLADLAQLLAAYNATFMTPAYDPQADFDMDGDIDLADLADMLANYQ